MELKQSFVANIYDVYGEAGKLWLQQLPKFLNTLAEHWNFQFLHPLSDLSYNFVGCVEFIDTKDKAIIKMAPEKGDLSTEVNWLNCFDKGVPKIYAHDKTHNAFLMEHLQPGYSLKSLVQEGKDDVATQTICETIRDLQFQHQGDIEFKHLSELPEALSILRDRIDNKLLSQAETWFQELTADRSQDVVLHGDLHHDNILLSESGWKTIDPHGYVGDPTAEVGVMIRNPNDCFPSELTLSQVVTRRLHIMRDELPFDKQRIKAWAFCMTLLSAAWTLEGHSQLSEHELEIARAINKVKV